MEDCLTLLKKAGGETIEESTAQKLKTSLRTSLMEEAKRVKGVTEAVEETKRCQELEKTLKKANNGMVLFLDKKVGNILDFPSNRSLSSMSQKQRGYSVTKQYLGPLDMRHIFAFTCHLLLNIK